MQPHFSLWVFPDNTFSFLSFILFKVSFLIVIKKKVSLQESIVKNNKNCTSNFVFTIIFVLLKKLIDTKRD